MILEAVFLSTLYFKCGEGVHPDVLHAIVRTESAKNPYVIANVTDNTSHRFENAEEAISYANKLQNDGKKYSVGLMQIFSENFKHYGLTNNNAFDYCTNISVGAKILKDCYSRSKKINAGMGHSQHLENGMSCYYSGNFSRGFKKDENLDTSYVDRIKGNLANIYEIPSFFDYKYFEQGKNDTVNNQEKISLPVVEENLNNWDVFNDYEHKK